MAQVKVLVAGKHEKLDDKLVIGATVTLIKSDKNIIVDPGYFTDQEKMLENLAKERLKPDDIDIVFLTHLHLDHLANVALFRNSHIYCKLYGGDYPGQYHIANKGWVIRTDIKDGLNLAKDVEFLLTPGHVEDHVSLVVDTEDGKVVIAGDALPNKEMVDIDKKPFLYSNLENYNSSRKKILKLAKFIVPGHGDIFKNS
ncbi:MBL fold metallo-hydrolase [bacterium]|nr:MBL fold metallo-hydrolase [bacterium]